MKEQSVVAYMFSRKKPWDASKVTHRPIQDEVLHDNTWRIACKMCNLKLVMGTKQLKRLQVPTVKINLPAACLEVQSSFCLSPIRNKRIARRDLEFKTAFLVKPPPTKTISVGNKNTKVLSENLPGNRVDASQKHFRKLMVLHPNKLSKI